MPTRRLSLPCQNVPSPARGLLKSVALASLLTAGQAAALIVPMEGWAPLNGDANRWTDAGGACLLQEERHTQSFPAFDTFEKASSFAAQMQKTLAARGKTQSVKNVAVQAVDREGAWGVLASYTFVKAGVTYRVSQLYLSDSGKLRTVTGSAEAAKASPCVSGMLEFVRYMAD